jgi:predicted metalloprotease
MRLDGHEQSKNVIDSRGRRGPAMAAGGGGILLVVMMIVMNLMGVDKDKQQLAIGAAKALQQRAAQAPAQPGEGINDEARVFIAQVLKSTENVWTKLFREQVQGGSYTAPKLEIYTGSVRTACGTGTAAMGPFYCPGDSKVYIDPDFFEELARRHKASGDFAQAYVIAHEVAHHVQNLTGYSDRVNEVRAQGDDLMSNQMSVRLELQADYLAGVWAHFADRDYNILESGDIEEGINAANRIGDDTLQKESQGYVRPERFTHGTSAQRAYWFRKGLETGSFEDCDELFRVSYERLSR